MKHLVALVGMKHRGTEALVASLPKGEPLLLRRDRHNKFDPWAVEVWARGRNVGFVKATQVKPIAMALDAAAGSVSDFAAQAPEAVPSLQRAMLQIDGERWPMVEWDDGENAVTARAEPHNIVKLRPRRAPEEDIG